MYAGNVSAFASEQSLASDLSTNFSASSQSVSNSGTSLNSTPADSGSPLPSNWEVKIDFNGIPFFVNHEDKQTTYIDPRDQGRKPLEFSDCVGDELPLGWEIQYDQHGPYFVNHLRKQTQRQDPRLQWREKQAEMIQDYLQSAKVSIQSKQELLRIKRERKLLAEREFMRVDNVYRKVQARNEGNAPAFHSVNSGSRTSLCSNSSCGSVKIDIEMLRHEVEEKRNTWNRLQIEEKRMSYIVEQQERGRNMLQEVDRSYNERNGVYTITEVRQLKNKLQTAHTQLKNFESEKSDLLKHIIMLSEQIQGCKSTDMSPDVSMLGLPQEPRFNIASQTDLSLETHINTDNPLVTKAEVDSLFDRTNKDLYSLSYQLAELNELINPVDIENDKDTVNLVLEKEKLLVELRSVSFEDTSEEAREELKKQIQLLVEDLAISLNSTNEGIIQRIELLEKRKQLSHLIGEKSKVLAQLDAKRKLFLSNSTSTLSSKSTNSSLGSLVGSHQSILVDMPSAAGLQEINNRLTELVQNTYATLPPQYIHAPSYYDMHNPVNVYSPKLPVGASVSMSHLSAPYPVFEQTKRTSQPNLQDVLLTGSSTDARIPNLQLAQLVHSHQGATPSTSYQMYPRRGSAPQSALIHHHSLFSHSHQDGLPPPGPRMPRCAPVVKNGTSIAPPPTYNEQLSAPVPMQTKAIPVISQQSLSDDSNAGDSGVYEGSDKPVNCEKRIPSSTTPPRLRNEVDVVQILISYEFESESSRLMLQLHKIHNVGVLLSPNDICKICIKGGLMPNEGSLFNTKWFLRHPVEPLQINEKFILPVECAKLFTKTLQLNIWSQPASGSSEHILGAAQVSLADFNGKSEQMKLINVLSYYFMSSHSEPNSPSVAPADPIIRQPPPYATVSPEREDSAVCPDQLSRRLNSVHTRRPQLAQLSNLAEESSDDSSTVISSQTSTLTRNQGPDCIKELATSTSLESVSSGESQPSVSLPYDPGFCLKMAEDTGVLESESPETLRKSDAQLIAAGKIPESLEEEDEEDEDYLVECIAEVVETCHASTNTDANFITKLSSVKRKTSRNLGPSRLLSVPATVNENGTDDDKNYVCKLNRSDSDSSILPIYRNETPFQRNVTERRSLRWKKPPSSLLGSSQRTAARHRIQHNDNFKTSVEIEIDLKTAEAKLAQQQDEVSRLRTMKKALEECKSRGEKDIPVWLSQNDNLMQYISTESGSTKPTKYSIKSDKEHYFVRKAANEAQKLRHAKQRLPLNEFRKKIGGLVSPNPAPTVVVIPSDDDEEVC